MREQGRAECEDGVDGDKHEERPVAAEPGSVGDPADRDVVSRRDMFSVRYAYGQQRGGDQERNAVRDHGQAITGRPGESDQCGGGEAAKPDACVLRRTGDAVPAVAVIGVRDRLSG